MKNIFKISVVALSFFLLTGCTLNKEGGVSIRNEDSQSEKTEKMMTLKDLINSGIAQKCTWNIEDQESQMSGEIIVQGEKFRQNAKITGANGQEMEFKYISDGEYLYSWSDDSMMGGMAFKMRLEDSQSQTDASDNPQEQSVNWDKEYDFNCNPTVVSESDFQAPEGIEFMNMNDLTNSFQNSIPNQEN